MKEIIPIKKYIVFIDIESDAPGCFQQKNIL